MFFITCILCRTEINTEREKQEIQPNNQTKKRKKKRKKNVQLSTKHELQNPGMNEEWAQELIKIERRLIT